ncbi:DNA glycosylase [Trametes maxima]|nr:DNA glycosylase [Trametes maxima]
MPPRIKRPRSPTPSLDDLADPPASPNKAKKLKLLASHFTASPFPDFPHPTPIEAAQVHALLSEAHPDLAERPRIPSEENDSAWTCGSVPNVLESLIGTILSQNTSARNSTAAKRGLDAAFGRNNFAAIAEARKEDVVEAIRTGGLANKKAGVIQRILEEVYKRHGEYSLQHLAAMAEPGGKGKGKVGSKVSDDEAMQELVSYDGVGPKTASCVLLFCLGRSSFPVDTHVFRLSRLLGWVPQKADRVTAQAHLDLTIPDELKYGLHVLMVGHGRRCKGCKSSGGGKSDCVLKKWLRERKGAKEEVLDAKVEDIEQLDALAPYVMPVKTED